MWQRERWKIERKKANRRGWDLHDFRWQMEASQTDTQRWGYTWRRATGHNRTCGHQERPLSCQPRWHRGPLGPCQPGAGMCQSTWQTNQHWNDVWNTLTAVIRDITHTHTLRGVKPFRQGTHYWYLLFEHMCAIMIKVENVYHNGLWVLVTVTHSCSMISHIMPKRLLNH